MASVIVAAAEAVRALLQTQSDAGSFIRTFTTQRVYSTTVELTDDELHVHVVHVANEIELIEGVRGKVQYTVPVFIAVRQRFGESERDPSTGFAATNEVDQLIELCEQIGEAFYGETSGGSSAMGPANIITLAPENYLREHNQFFGLLRVSWRQYKTA